MARPAPFALAAVAGLTVLLAAGRGHAEGVRTPIALSAACQVPEVDIATAGRLPRTAERLKAGGDLRVLAIGSSSTAGIGASSPNAGYPAQVEAILEAAFKGLDVIMVSRGVSGEAAATTAGRLRTQVAIEKPDLVLWQVGTNDALARVPLDEFTDTVADTVHWLREHRIDVVLVGLQYLPKMARDPYYSSVRAALHRIATDERVLLVRRFEAMEYLNGIRAGALLSPDGLHLNDLGYRCMAEHVARAIVAGAFDFDGRQP